MDFFCLLIFTDYYEVDFSQCDCPKRCPQSYKYDPVCGYNGNTYHIFDGTCAMENVNCQNPKEPCKWI
jgi:hypothetical protein